MHSITVGCEDIPVQFRLLNTSEWESFAKREGTIEVGVFGLCSTIEIEDYRKGRHGEPRMRIEIALKSDHVGDGAVTHEALHAVLSIIRRRFRHRFTSDFFGPMAEHRCDTDHFGDPEHDPEEFMAYALGNLVSKFWTQFFARGYDKLKEFRKVVEE
jgi:hypothetical protein